MILKIDSKSKKIYLQFKKNSTTWENFKTVSKFMTNQFKFPKSWTQAYLHIIFYYIKPCSD